MMNTALAIGARHALHTVRIMCFSHDGKGIPAKAGCSMLAIMILWCALRALYTLLRLDSDDTTVDELLLALGLSAVAPLLLRACLRAAAFFVFAHASLFVEVLLLLDATSSVITGQPPLLTGVHTGILVIWSILATGFTMFKYLRRN